MNAQGDAGANLLSIFEAQAYAKMIGPFSVKDVGSKAWMRQHNLIEQLNIQAHKNAVTRHDEFVVEAILEYEKIPTLIHHLLCTEAWKEKIFPLIYSNVKLSACIKVYVALYHEATVCNLLEVLLYHANACENGGDSICELADYCYRKLVKLSNKRIVPPPPQKNTPDLATIEAETSSDTLKRQAKDIEYTTAMSCITLMRFLTEHISVLPVSVPRQLLDNLDVLMILVPLMEATPWQRRTKEGMEKYVENKWMRIERKDRFRLCKLEAQVWLTIYNLLMDKGCRAMYDFTNYRKEVLTRLKRYINDLLKDQLPILKDLQRLLEEISMMQMPAPAKPLHLVVPVARIREAIYTKSPGLERKENEWQDMAKAQLKGPFSHASKDMMEEMRALAETYSGGVMEALIEDPKCGRCGKPAAKRCSSCHHEWYCGRKCQVKAWQTHKPVCELLSGAIKNKSCSKVGAKAEAKGKKSQKNGDTDGKKTIPGKNSSPIVDITDSKQIEATRKQSSRKEDISDKPSASEQRLKSTPVLSSEQNLSNSLLGEGNVQLSRIPESQSAENAPIPVDTDLLDLEEVE